MRTPNAHDGFTSWNDHEQWWHIGQPNGEPIYGYGTEAEARAYCVWRSRYLDANHWDYRECDDYDESARDDGINLSEELLLRMDGSDDEVLP